MEKKYFLLIDTEATPNGLVYDMGYLIILKENSKLYLQDKKHFLIQEVFDNRPLFDTAYYHDKRNKYYNLLRHKKIKKALLKDALKEIRKDIIYYNIDEFYAYNAQYDTQTFMKTTDYYKKSNPIAELNYICLMNLSNKYIHSTKDYQSFCNKYGFITDNGFYKTNAEVTYKYITKQINFIEKHMALDDALLEFQILKYIYKNNKNIEINNDRKFFPTNKEQTLTIEIKNNENIITNRYNFKYKQIYKKKDKIILVK